MKKLLSDTAKRYLSSLEYKPEAKKWMSLMPLGGIYWTDEIPDFHMLKQMSDDARGQIYRLFQIRYAIWDGVELSPEDLKFLELTRLMVPECPIFKRLVPTEDDLLSQKYAREEVSGIYDMMAERSEYAEDKINKDGSVSTTWHLKKKKI